MCAKFKDISKTSERLSYGFKDYKFMNNTNLHIKILFANPRLRRRNQS